MRELYFIIIIYTDVKLNNLVCGKYFVYLFVYKELLNFLLR